MQKYSVGRERQILGVKKWGVQTEWKIWVQSLEKPDLFPAGGARFLHDLNKDGPSTAELEECDFIQSRVVWIDLFIKGLH